MPAILPRIITEHVNPPLDGDTDWLAYYEGEEADAVGRMNVGWGAREADAVLDLIDDYRRGVQCTRDRPFLSAVTAEAARTR